VASPRPLIPLAAAAPPAGRVTLDVTDESVREVLRSIAAEAGVNIVLDPEVDARITLRLMDVGWRDALDVIARDARLRVVEEGDLVRLSRPPLIRMEFQDADVRTALLVIAAQAGVSIVIPADIQGKVSLSLKDVPWMDALDAVAASSGYVIVREGPRDP
jgi:type II secretory pathway component HofQ